MVSASFICLDCHRDFDEPLILKESYGFNDGFYEGIPVCPHCGGGFAAAHYCDECEQLIVEQYIRTASGKELCNECFSIREVGEN